MNGGGGSEVENLPNGGAGGNPRRETTPKNEIVRNPSSESLRSLTSENLRNWSQVGQTGQLRKKSDNHGKVI